MTATNKRYSYLRVAAIRIDVHPQGKTRSTRHMLSTLDSHMTPDHTSPVVRVGNLSLVPTRIKHAPTPRRNLGDQRQTGPAVVLGHLIPHLSRQLWSRGERFRPSGDIDISAYWAHNISMWSVRSMLARGGQPISPQLTHAGDTTLKVSAFHTPLSDLHNQQSSPFHLRASPGFQLNHNLTTKTELSFKGTYGRHVVFRPLDCLT
jgi:hypothetical protein